MKQPNITIYGSRTCPDTNRTTAFLDARSVPYEFKDVDADPQYNDYIAGLNGGKRVIPTLQIDNQAFINPPEADLARALDEAAAAR
jgi:thioredoxin reductase (NADPH)